MASLDPRNSGNNEKRFAVVVATFCCKNDFVNFKGSTMINDSDLVTKLFSLRGSAPQVELNDEVEGRYFQQLIVRAAHCLSTEAQSFVRNEIIGMLHGVLGYYLCNSHGEQQKAGNSLIAESIATTSRQIAFDGKYFLAAQLNRQQKMQLFIGLCASGRMEIALFESIFDDYGMTWDEVGQGYVAAYERG